MFIHLNILEWQQHIFIILRAEQTTGHSTRTVLLHYSFVVVRLANNNGGRFTHRCLSRSWCQFWIQLHIWLQSRRWYWVCSLVDIALIVDLRYTIQLPSFSPLLTSLCAAFRPLSLTMSQVDTFVTGGPQTSTWHVYSEMVHPPHGAACWIPLSPYLVIHNGSCHILMLNLHKQK